MKKIKVLQMIGSLRTGGAEKVVYNFFRNMDHSNYEFHFLIYDVEVSHIEEEIISLGGNVYRIARPEKGYYKYYKNVLNIMIEKGPFDVVHSHRMFNSGIIMKAAYKAGIPVRIAHSHSARFQVKRTYFDKVYHFIMRKTIKKYATEFLACSTDAGSYLYSSPFFEEKGKVIYNGIELEKYKFDNSLRDEIRNKFNVKDSFCIGHVGRFAEVKNHSFILKVFKELLMLHKNSKLILVGDGELKNKITQEAKELGVHDNTLFLGNREDVNEILQMFDVFLFPSKYEGLGLSIIEAQAVGMKCVISDTIPHEVDLTSLITRVSLNDSPNKWAEQILKNKTESTTKDREEIKKLYERGYDINKVIESISNIYQ